MPVHLSARRPSGLISGVIDVRRLRVLREVALTHSVSRAAERLGYTPSAVSQQLAALERETGSVLIERNGRGIRLTPSADVLVAHTKILFEQLERAEADLAAVADNVAGAVTITSIPTVTRTVLPRVLAVLGDRHPDLSVTLREAGPEGGLPDLVLGTTDILIGEEYDVVAPTCESGEVHRTELFCERVLLVQAARYGRNAGLRVDLESFAGRCWILPPADSELGAMHRRACAAAGFDPRVVAETADIQVAVALVSAGLGVALIPRLGISHATPPISISELSRPINRRVFAATRSGREEHPAIAACVLALREQAQAL